MKEITLKYGANPNQSEAKIFATQGELPITVLSGRPGYINFLDALNAWQLVKEVKASTNMCCAASFKHVSPAGVGLGLPLDNTLEQMYFVEGMELSPLACAYARARGADRMSSFGDWIALSDICDKETALVIKPEVSDGVIAPGYTPEALEILKAKRKGSFNVVEIDPNYNPPESEVKEVYGISFEQSRNHLTFTESDLENIVTDNKNMTAEQKRDLLLCLVTLKYTQSNSVCYAKGGQIIGVGAGQQSRIHCTRLAGTKADLWHLRQHPAVLALPFSPTVGRANRDNAIDVFLSDDYLDVIGDDNWAENFTEQPKPLTRDEKQDWLSKVTGVCLGSDAFFPFGDNIIRAHRSGVTAIVQPGGSIRDDQVIETCNKFGIAMACNGKRLFHH